MFIQYASQPLICYLQFFYRHIVICIFISIPSISHSYGLDWSTTELHYQYGNLKHPFLRKNTDTSVITLQHASGWRYGDNFLFLDTIIPHPEQTDYYGEYYGNLSLGKISGRQLSFGPIKDFGILMGINWAPKTGVLKYLPGMRISWNLPGFMFLNSDFTAYIDDSDSSVVESNSFMVDINGRYTFRLFNSNFNLEGHIEYVGERRSHFGLVRDWFFGQIQLRYDLGQLLFNQSQKVFAGTEWQFWNNKFGTNVDENVAQALLVWRM